jgi:hypothetical protein
VGRTEDEAAVDVLRRGEAGLEHPDRREHERNQQGIHHEPRPVLGVDRLLVQHVLDEPTRPRNRLFTGQQARHELDERQDRHRVEEVHAHDLLGAPRRDRELHHRDRGGVGRLHGVRILHDLVQPAEQVHLGGLVLHDRLDHKLAVGEFVEVGRGADPPQRLLGVVDLSSVLGTAQRRLDPRPAGPGPRPR